MSEGYLLRAVVRGLMSDEFLESADLVMALESHYKGPSGDDAVTAIAEIYNDMPDQNAKKQLRGKLLKADKLRRRFTREGIKEIAEFYLLGIEDDNIKRIQVFFGTLVEHLLLFKEKKTFHFAGAGLPGVGKSTALIAIVQLILFGKIGSGDNEALGRLLEQQKQCLAKLPESIRGMVINPTPNGVYIQCDPGTMTATRLQAAIREQLPTINLRHPNANLEAVICGIFLDEIDLLGTMKPKDKKDKLVAQLADLTEGNLTSPGWHRTEDRVTHRVTHHIKVFGWIGNICPHNPRSSALAQRQSVVGQMKDFLSGKFTPERLPSALNCILLR